MGETLQPLLLQTFHMCVRGGVPEVLSKLQHPSRTWRASCVGWL